jgi:hypothetical protein
MPLLIMTTQELNAAHRVLEQTRVSVQQVHVTSNYHQLCTRFNAKRLRDPNAEVVKILATYDLFHYDAFRIALDRFVGELNDWEIRQITRDRMFDDCPDPTVGVHIVIALKTYKSDHPWWKRLLIKLRFVDEY